MNKVHVITLENLERALHCVTAELARLGVWTQELYAVDVYLTPLHAGGLVAYGWKYDGRHGCIEIPSVSLPRLAHYFGVGRYLSLADVIRHEYGHAVADVYRRFTRCRRFRDVFGASYDSGRASSYDPATHITHYASSEPAEDFAEVFTAYVRKAGRLPQQWNTRRIRNKWCFIERLCEAIGRGQRGW